MVWFKVDDKLHDHRKARAAGKAAMGLWVLAGSWSIDNDMDGFVPEGVLSRWGTRADASKLVVAGLWYVDKHNDENGWRFHDWTHFQPSAAVTAAKQAAEREAGVRGNHTRWHVKRGVSDPDCPYCYRVPDQEPDGVPDPPPDRVKASHPESAPIPTVPVPVPDTSGGEKARTDEAPTQALVGEWIEHCGDKRPPKQVIGQTAKHVKALLEEGIPASDVRAGLAAWHRKSLNPSTLPSVVHETRMSGATPPVNEWMRR